MTTPTNAPTVAAVDLSREELAVVLRLLKIPALPGFDMGWLTVGADGQPTLPSVMALEAGTNALIARGYLSDLSNTADGAVRVELPSPVIALVGACAYSAYSLLLAMQTPAGPLQFYFHELRELGVAHSVPIGEIHQFQALDGRAGVLAAVGQLAALSDQPAPAVPAGAAPVVYVQEARDLALAGAVPEAEAALVRGGLDIATSRVLAAAMHAPLAYGSLVCALRDAYGVVTETGIALVVAADGCFILSALADTPTHYSIQPSTADRVRAWLATALS